jgi:NAD(P)-dependent dehydrogenase (short-subunit alcohol dehydrogenase family)
MKLTGKKALITGGNSGIGLATARLFIAEGAQVAITGRDQKTLDEAIAELGSSARGYSVDVTIAEDRERSSQPWPKISGSSTSSSPMPASPAGLLPARPTRPFLRT